MVFGFFRKRKAQPAAQQQEAELVQAVEEAVQTEEVAAQPASETTEQSATQTPDDAISVAEPDSTDLAKEASAHKTASTEVVSAEAAPAPLETLLEPGLATTRTDKTANALPTVETAKIVETSAAKAEEAAAFGEHGSDGQANNEQAVSEPVAAESVVPSSTDQAAIEPVPEQPAALGWAARLRQGLSKSRQQMAKSLASVFGGGKIDEDLYEELETVLLTSDMGIEATEHLMEEVRQRVSLRGLKDGE